MYTQVFNQLIAVANYPTKFWNNWMFVYSSWFVTEWCTGCIHLATNWISAYCGTHWICGKSFCPCAYRWSKSSEECCTELFWPSLSSRRKYLSSTMIYSILHNEVSLQVSDYFTFSSAPTRSSHSLSFYANSPPLTLIITHFSWTGVTPFLLTFCHFPLLYF